MLSFVCLDQTMMCFATGLFITCLFLQINKDLSTVFYRQLNRLLSFFNDMSSYKINRRNISQMIEGNNINKLTFYCRHNLFLQTWFTRGQSGHCACSFPHLHFPEKLLFLFFFVFAQTYFSLLSQLYTCVTTTMLYFFTFRLNSA